MSHCSPSAFACWFIEVVLPLPHRDAILGDLIEEYALRVKSTSSLTASRWFWSQASRSVPSLVWSWLRSGTWLVSVSIAMGVYTVMLLLKLAADLVISKWIATQQTTYIVLAPVVFLAITATGGCVAARIRRGAMFFLAFIVMITVALLIKLKVCPIPVPWWYQFGFLTLGPLTVFIAPAIVWLLKKRAQGPAS